MHNFLEAKEHNKNPKGSLEQVLLPWTLQRIGPGRTNILMCSLFIESVQNSNYTQRAYPPTKGQCILLQLLRQLPQTYFLNNHRHFKEQEIQLRNHVLIVEVQDSKPYFKKTGFQQDHILQILFCQLRQHMENNIQINEKAISQNITEFKISSSRAHFH